MRKGWTLEAPPSDPYLKTRKYTEPSLCKACGVVYRKGHSQELLHLIDHREVFVEFPGALIRIVR